MGDLLRHSIKLETRIKWLENGLKEIANGRDDMNGIYIKQQAQATLDGEPTTADEYNDEEDVQLGASIVKSNDEVSGVFMSDGKIKQIDYESSPENTVRGLNVITSGMDALAKDNKKYVRMSDINKEIAKEWNRDREKTINKEKTK